MAMTRFAVPSIVVGVVLAMVLFGTGDRREPRPRSDEPTRKDVLPDPVAKDVAAVLQRAEPAIESVMDERTTDQRVDSTPSGVLPESSAVPARGDVPDLREVLVEARRHAKEEGVVLSDQWPKSNVSMQSMLDAYSRYRTACDEIQALRMPVLESISDAKKARGEVEPMLSSRDMPPGLSPEGKREWQRDAAKARSPSRPGQTVITMAEGSRRYLVRVDLDEDPRLQLSHERFQSERKLFVRSVQLAFDSDG